MFSRAESRPTTSAPQSPQKQQQNSSSGSSSTERLPDTTAITTDCNTAIITSTEKKSSFFSSLFRSPQSNQSTGTTLTKSNTLVGLITRTFSSSQQSLSAQSAAESSIDNHNNSNIETMLGGGNNKQLETLKVKRDNNNNNNNNNNINIINHDTLMLQEDETNTTNMQQSEDDYSHRQMQAQNNGGNNDRDKQIDGNYSGSSDSISSSSAVSDDDDDMDDDDDDDDEEEEDDDDEESDANDSSEEISWISWFCGLEGHEILCEVEEQFIEDAFNMTGLREVIKPFYDEALEMILDIGPDGDFSANEMNAIERSAELLYSLIHQRYITTTRSGMSLMYEKYTAGKFGYCPRFHCSQQPTLMIGISDHPVVGKVKQFCPRCLDLYEPVSTRQAQIDGCAFGTTAPHLMINQFPDAFEDVRKHWSSFSEYLPDRHCKVYRPAIYGFQLHRTNPVCPRMGWLRRMRVEPALFEQQQQQQQFTNQSQSSLIVNNASNGNLNPLEGSDC